jgi:hypothetical protein
MNWHVQCGQCKSPRKTTAQRVEHGVHDRVVVLGQWTLRQRSPQTLVSDAMTKARGRSTAVDGSFSPSSMPASRSRRIARGSTGFQRPS